MVCVDFAWVRYALPCALPLPQIVQQEVDAAKLFGKDKPSVAADSKTCSATYSFKQSVEQIELSEVDEILHLTRKRAQFILAEIQPLELCKIADFDRYTLELIPTEP